MSSTRNSSVTSDAHPPPPSSVPVVVTAGISAPQDLIHRTATFSFSALHCPCMLPLDSIPSKSQGHEIQLSAASLWLGAGTCQNGCTTTCLIPAHSPKCSAEQCCGADIPLCSHLLTRPVVGSALPGNSHRRTGRVPIGAHDQLTTTPLCSH